MPNLALVTGGAGFIGSHLVEALLDRGWRVRVIDDLSTGRREHVPTGAEFIEGDIRDATVSRHACADVTVIFHLAARVSVRQSMTSFVDDADVNIGGTLRLLESARDSSVKRFILASSMAVYADAAAGTCITEAHPATPLSPYGIGKLAAEHYVLLLGQEFGIEPVVLRFFNTFGPRQGYTPYVGVATIFITRMLAGQECVIFGDGRQCRDFTHVADIVQGCLRAAESPDAAGHTINVGTGIGTTVNELASLLSRILGRGSFRHQPRDSSELRYSVADLTKARLLLSYQPRIELAEGLPAVVDEIRRRTAS